MAKKKKTEIDKNRKRDLVMVGTALDELPHEDRFIIVAETIRLLAFQLSQSEDDQIVDEVCAELDDIGAAIEDLGERLTYKNGWAK